MASIVAKPAAISRYFCPDYNAALIRKNTWASMIDIGANLCHDSFDADRDQVLNDARSAGVSQIIVTGSCRQSIPAACSLAEQHPGLLYATAGIHPHHAEQVDETCLALLSEYGKKPAVVASGEMGLDFFRDFSPRDVQEKAFHQQLECRI